jgi:hypothetical protein
MCRYAWLDPNCETVDLGNAAGLEARIVCAPIPLSA